MAACIDEIRREEVDAKADSTKPRSRNDICKDHKLFQVTQIYHFGLWRGAFFVEHLHVFGPWAPSDIFTLGQLFLPVLFQLL